VNIVHDENLPVITWISKDLLISGHSGIETNFTTGGANGAEGLSVTSSAIFQNENCCFLIRHFKNKLRKNTEALLSARLLPVIFFRAEG
jgi:hypothetical protein